MKKVAFLFLETVLKPDTDMPGKGSKIFANKSGVSNEHIPI